MRRLRRHMGLRCLRAARRLKGLLLQAAEQLQVDPDERAARRTVDLLALTEVLGVEISVDRLQDVVFELLRKDAVSSWPKELRSSLCAFVGVEELQGG